MLLGKQHHLITRYKKCTRQARTQKSKSPYPMSPPIPWPHPLASILSVNLYAHIASRNHFPCLFSPPISSHSVAPTPSAAVRKLAHPQRLLLPSHPLAHTPSAAVRAAQLAHSQHLLLPTHFQALLARTPSAAVRAAKLISSGFFSPPIFHPLPCTHAVRSRPRSQARSSPATPLHQPISSHSLAPTPSAAVRAGKLAHPQRLFSPPISSHPLAPKPLAAVRSSPAASSPHFQPLPCTHAVRSHQRSQAHSFPAAFCLQPSSLIPSDFFSPSISSHSLAPTPSAAVRAAKLAHPPVSSSRQPHPQHLLLPTHFQPPPCTHAVRVRAAKLAYSQHASSGPPIFRHSLAPTASAAVRAAKLAHPQRLFFVHSFPATPLHPSKPSAASLRSQARSSPAASSPHPFPATPLHPRCPQPVRAAKLAHSQHLLFPIHFHPLPCNHAVRSRPRSQARSSPAASSPQSFTPLHTHRPQPSAQPSSLIPSGFFSPPISSHSLAPTPSAAVHAAKLAHPQRLLLNTHFQFAHPQRLLLPPISTHSLATMASAAVRAAKKLAHPQQLLLPTHFQPLPSTHAVRSRPPNYPHPFAVRSRPRSQARTHPQRLLLPTHFQPLPRTHAVPNRPRNSRHPFAIRSRPRSKARSSQRLLLPTHFQPLPLHPRRPQPSAQFSAPICRPQPSAQPSSLITSGFFSPPISSHSVAPTQSATVRSLLRTHFPSATVCAAKLVIPKGFLSPPISSHSLAPTPSAAVRAILPIHLPSAAVRAAKLAHHQRLLLPIHFQPLPCTHAVRSRPRNSPHPFPVRNRPRSQARSSPAASSPHPFPATPLHPRRPQPSAPFSQARSSPAASSPYTHFQPLPWTHAVRSRPRNSPHPFPVRSSTRCSRPKQKRKQGKERRQRRCRHRNTENQKTFLSHECPIAERFASMSQVLLQAICTISSPSSMLSRSLPAKLSPSYFHGFVMSSMLSRPLQRSSPQTFPTHFPSAAVRAAKLAHHQRLLLPTHFQLLPCTHAVAHHQRLLLLVSDVNLLLTEVK